MIPSFPFDPVARAQEVESLVMQGDKRRYFRFRHAKFYGGIVTADASGCNLLCAYCWNIVRNSDIETINDRLYSPKEVAEKIADLQQKTGMDKCRVSGCEPILGNASAKHLGDVLRRCHGSDKIIETNGIMIGYEPDLLRHIPSDAYIRITLKADSKKSFAAITGAKASSFKYQLIAIKELIASKRKFCIGMMKQFVDIEKLSVELVKQGVEFGEKMPGVDIDGLLYYPQSTKSMKDRGVKPLYGNKAR
jgi:uncharacterized Fe-S cluster-containing radical SAM superfamily protein